MANQKLEIPPVPPLGTSGLSYSQDLQNQNNNVLRLFFIRLMGVLSSLFGPAGIRYIDTPNGLFFSTEDQTIAANNTGYAVTFNNTYLGNNLSVVDSSKITAVYGGIYQFQFSGQVKSTNASAKDVFLWMKRNGTTLGYTTHQYTIEGSDNHTNINWNFSIDLSSGQYLQFFWAGSDTALTLETTAATSPHPGIPSAVVSVTYVAPLPDTLPTPP